jgi:ATP-binding protein involved in chromosome partitioning
MIDRQLVMTAMEQVIDPEIRRNVVELNMVRDVAIDGSSVAVDIALTTPGCPLKQNIQDQVVNAVGAVAGVTRVTVEFSFMNEAERTALRTQLRGAKEQRSPGIAVPKTARIIAVASGKGGVGKSTVTANLAAAMARRGHEVGVLDADVYGYSIPQVLGVQQRPVTVDGMIVPPVAGNDPERPFAPVRLMSIGFFLDQDEPVMWRGPMLHRALEQFLGDVHWGEIEYLFVDMPPGTGDIAISLGQMLPQAEVLVVTTPQHAAQRVAERSAAMATKLGQQVIGVVENMSGIDGAPSVFGEGGGQTLADSCDVPLLGQIPLDGSVRESGDAGHPTTGAAAESFDRIAEAIAAIEPPAPPPADPVDRIKKPLAVL